MFQLLADVRLGDLHPVLHPLEDHAVVGDVVVVEDGLLPPGEGLVRDDADVPGVIDQGIPGDARGGLIGLAEAAVDDDQLAAALDGALPLLGLHGDVAVDDVAVGSLQTELL